MPLVPCVCVLRYFFIIRVCPTQNYILYMRIILCCLCNMLYYSISHHINIILKCVSFSRAHADKIVSLHSKHWEQNHRPRFACFVSSISNSSVRWTSLLCALILHYANIYICYALPCIVTSICPARMKMRVLRVYSYPCKHYHSSTNERSTKYMRKRIH